MAHKVLILDDDLHAGRLIVQALAVFPVEAEAFQSVKSALAAFKAMRPSLVILDVLLPEGDGFKVAEELRRQAPDLPIVFVSAVYKKPQVARDVQARFDAPLVLKPFDLAVLRKAVADGLKLPFQASAPQKAVAPAPERRTTPAPQSGVGPMAGDLARKPLYALLGEVYRGRATGVLELVREPLRKRIYLELGFVRFATSNVRAENATGLLVADGLVSEAQAAAAVELARSRQMQLHEALVATGSISPAQLQPLLRRQTAEVVVAGCGLPDGSYTFQPVKELTVPEARQHPLALALQGVKRFYPLPAIREYLQARAGLALFRSPDLDREDYTIKQIFPNEKVTPLVNGRTMVLEAVEKVSDAELPLLFGLIGMGLVGFQPFAAGGVRTTTSTGTAGPSGNRSPTGVTPATPGGSRTPTGLTPAGSRTPSFTPVITPGPSGPRVGLADGGRTPGFAPAGATPTGATPGRGVLVESKGAGALPALDPADLTPVDPMTDALRAGVLAEYQRVITLDHYALLGVDRKAGVPDIRRAYLDAAKRWHADSFAGVNLGQIEPYLQAVFSAIGEAQRVLSDPKARAEYDVLLDRKERGLPTDVGAILEAEELFGKAENLFRNDRIQEAEALLRRAVQLNHAEAEFWAYLGACTLRLRGAAGAVEARSCFQRARELMPELPVTEVFTAQLEALEGNLDAADDRLSRLLLEKPDHREAAAQLRALRDRRHKEARSGGLLDKLLNRK